MDPPFRGRCAGRWPLLTAHVRQVAAHGCGALVIHQVVRAARLVPPFGEWERRVRVGGLVDTLLGPEGTGVSPVASDCGTGHRLTCYGCGGAGGPGCFLRTAQWTRASLVRALRFCLSGWGRGVLICDLF